MDLKLSCSIHSESKVNDAGFPLGDQLTLLKGALWASRPKWQVWHNLLLLLLETLPLH